MICRVTHSPGAVLLLSRMKTVKWRCPIVLSIVCEQRNGLRDHCPRNWCNEPVEKVKGKGEISEIGPRKVFGENNRRKPGRGPGTG